MGKRDRKGGREEEGGFEGKTNNPPGREGGRTLWLLEERGRAPISKNQTLGNSHCGSAG